MRVIVMGGGKVGGFMARELQEGGHAVIVIERNTRHAQQVTEETGALVIEGDGTDLELLEDIEIRPTDLFVAVTGVDEDNLVACQLVRTAFEVRKVLARLNDPRNRPTFDALRIPVVSVTDLLAQVIERELEFGELVRVAILGKGEVSLFQIELPPTTITRTVEAVDLPEEAVLVAVQRGDTVHIPSPTFELRSGDRVMAVGKVHLEDDVRNALLSADRHNDGPGFELEPRTP
jgi:trk system potassium uptake protein